MLKLNVLSSRIKFLSSLLMIGGFLFAFPSFAQQAYNCSELISASLDKTELSLGEEITLTYDILNPEFTADSVFWHGNDSGIGSTPVSGSPAMYTYQGHAGVGIQVKILLRKTADSSSVHCDVGAPIDLKGACGNGTKEWNEDCDQGAANGESCSSECTWSVPECSYLTVNFTPEVDSPSTIKAEFSLLKDWVKLRSVDWGEGGNPYTNLTSPIFYEYSSPGTYSPVFNIYNSDNTEYEASCTFENAVNISPECGNSIVEITEQCDDGNTDSGDGCSASCQWEEPTCPELTFSQSSDNPRKYSAQIASTPDWVVLGSLAWGDGSDISNPSTTETYTYQNPGVYTPSLLLKNNGNQETFTSCTYSAISIDAVCGDGNIESGEQCDDGNTDSGDGCSATCQWETPSCSNLTANFTSSADNILAFTVDFSNSSPWSKVTSLYRGEGSVSNDPISPASHTYSGLGIYSPFFTLVHNSDESLSVDCPFPDIILSATCGNNTIESGEQCDDGNTNSGDGCSATCQWEAPSCSNLHLTLDYTDTYVPFDVLAKFSIDDGFQAKSINWGDGKTDTISQETSMQHTYLTTGEYAVQLFGVNVGNTETTGVCEVVLTSSKAVCGDSIVESKEQCDDGNTESGDGCSATCQLEYPELSALNFKVSPSNGYAPLAVTATFNTLTGFRVTALDFGTGAILATGTETLSGAFNHSYTTVGTHTVKLSVVNILSGALIKDYMLPVTVTKKPSGGGGGGGGGSGGGAGSSGGGGGGGASYIQKDYCPSGDLSPSYYDGKCDAESKPLAPSTPIVPTKPVLKPEITHSSAPEFSFGTERCEVPRDTSYPKDLVSAYQWAYSYKITTVCPIENANLDGALLRRHMAKMISEFAIQILGKKPDTSKKCDYPDIADQTDEMKKYIKLSCQLGLMGYASDGITKKSVFEPNREVSSAQFATLLSRLIWEGKFNNGDPVNYYTEHIKNLRATNIMEYAVDNPKDTVEKRGAMMKMLKNTYQYQQNLY